MTWLTATDVNPLYSSQTLLDYRSGEPADQSRAEELAASTVSLYTGLEIKRSARNPTMSKQASNKMQYPWLPTLIRAFVLTTLFLSSGAYAQYPAQLEAAFILDRQGELSFDQLRALPESNWAKVQQRGVGVPVWNPDYWSGLRGGVMWLRLELPVDSKSELLWVELLPNTGLNGEAIQFKQNEWRWIDAAGSSSSQNAAQPARYLTFVFDTTVAEKTAYLRLTTDQVFQFSINATPQDDLLWKAVKTQFYFGTVIGMFVLAFCYNLAIGLRARERLYLTYNVFVFGNLVYLLDMSGLIRLVFPAIGSGSYLANFTSTMTVMASWVFARELLNTRKHLPQIDRFLRVSIAPVTVLLVLIPFMSDLYGYVLAISVGIAGPLLIMAVVAFSIRQGHPLATYFFVAWIFYIISAGLWGWMWLGLVQPGEWLIFLFFAGALIEVALLSMVLGLRFNSLKRKVELLGADKNRYKTLSLTDELTGVLNRRGFLEAAERVFAHNPSESLIWLSMDIDHFKRFNDTHGHLSGDKLLRAFGATLKDCSRNDDIVGRLGGEEFGLLLVGCPLDKLDAFTARLLERFAEITVTSGNGEQVSTTLSIGATLVTDGDSIESAWKRGDELLYTAKNQGRNQMVFG